MKMLVKLSVQCLYILSPPQMVVMVPQEETVRRNLSREFPGGLGVRIPGEKWSISYHISKQRMSHSSAIAATTVVSW